jgi:hypothetical protein
MTKRLLGIPCDVGHRFAGEKGLRSSVRRDKSFRGTGGCGQRVAVRSERLCQKECVTGHQIRPAHQGVARECDHEP